MKPSAVAASAITWRIRQIWFEAGSLVQGTVPTPFSADSSCRQSRDPRAEMLQQLLHFLVCSHVSQSVYLSVSVCVCLCLSVSVCVCLCLSVSVCLFVCLPLSVCRPVCLSHCASIRLCLSPGRLFACLFAYFWAGLCLFTCLVVRQFVSLIGRLCVCVCCFCCVCVYALCVLCLYLCVRAAFCCLLGCLFVCLLARLLEFLCLQCTTSPLQ